MNYHAHFHNQKYVFIERECYILLCLCKQLIFPRSMQFSSRGTSKNVKVISSTILWHTNVHYHKYQNIKNMLLIVRDMFVKMEDELRLYH